MPKEALNIDLKNNAAHPSAYLKTSGGRSKEEVYEQIECPLC